MYLKLLLIVLSTCLVAGCKSNEQGKAKSSVPQQVGTNMPQLKKIPIQDKAQADSLLQQGFELIVVEDDYVIARLKPNQVSALGAAHVKIEPVEEADLVQRLVKIPVADDSTASKLANLGMDIWEVEKDTVVAQAFDKQIREAEAKGFAVKIVARNVLDTVKK
ncbi:MAG: hypothetical protein ACE5HO_19810 [bacterium]